MEKCLGFSQADIDLAEKMVAEGLSEEEKDLADVIKEMSNPVGLGGTGIVPSEKKIPTEKIPA
jgi:hypothetical protein